MIRPDTGLRVYLCREPVDMRKQIDGLALLVQEAMELNPFEGQQCSCSATASATR